MIEQLLEIDILKNLTLDMVLTIVPNMLTMDFH